MFLPSHRTVPQIYYQNIPILSYLAPVIGDISSSSGSAKDILPSFIRDIMALKGDIACDRRPPSTLSEDNGRSCLPDWVGAAREVVCQTHDGREGGRGGAGEGGQLTEKMDVKRINGVREGQTAP